MSELTRLLYDYVMEHRMEDYLDQRECGRLERQCALEEEKLESLLPIAYKRLLREYGEHLNERRDADMEAIFRAALALVEKLPA